MEKFSYERRVHESADDRRHKCMENRTQEPKGSIDNTFSVNSRAVLAMKLTWGYLVI